MSERPLCAEVSAALGEPLGATASRIESWLLVEYGGYWPYEPLDAAVFTDGLRDRLAAQLAAMPHSRLLLVKRPGRDPRERVEVVYGSCRERGTLFRRLELEHHGDLAELDFAGALAGEREPFGEPLDHPLLLVCTHGKRDRCCARYGQALCVALSREAPPEWVRQVTHVGGDRFAGNLVCLPEGLYFGRVGREALGPLLQDYRAGRIDLDSYRGRSCYPFPVQAAELEARRRLSLTGFWDLVLVGAPRDGDGWSVTLRAEIAGTTVRARVERELGEERFLTCKATAARPPRRFVATSVALGAAEEPLADEPADEHEPARRVERPR